MMVEARELYLEGRLLRRIIAWNVLGRSSPAWVIWSKSDIMSLISVCACWMRTCLDETCLKRRKTAAKPVVLRFFLFHTSLVLRLASSLRTVLRNTFRLNTASFLHAVHGSLIPFLPTFYVCPSLHTHYLNAASSHLSHCPSLSFTVYPPQFLCYEHCLVHVLYSHLFK